MNDEQEEVEESPAGGGMQLELVKSYLHFIRRAIRKRLWIVFSLAIVGFALTLVTYKYFPRTFVCTTVMMGDGNPVFNDQPAPFGAAHNLILRRANLEALVRDTGLIKKFVARRPPVLRLKDSVIQTLFGEWDDATLAAMLIPTIESRLEVSIEGSTMSVSVRWTDGQTAKELAEAARESFLKVRQDSNTEAFREKTAILEGHAAKLREEIEQLADQIDAAEKANRPAASASAVASAPRPAVRRASRRAAVEVTEGSTLQDRQRLEEMKRKLADLEGERERRIRDEKSKLAELQLRLSPSHPSVIMAEQRIGMLQQIPSEMALLQAEVKDLEAMITQRDAMAKQAVNGARSQGTVGPSSDPLPAAITAMLEEEDADPALLANLGGAIQRYGSLRDQIRAVSIDLDTARAAFNQQYKIVVPAEVPYRPVKPKPVAILGGGFGAALLIALLLPILLELRTGVIVERWQVQMVQLPVLAEMRLPPRAGE